MTKTAVVLFNLGGPYDMKAVRPFLFNLFYDPAIIPLPKPLRWLVAQCISLKRTPKAKAIYQQMGGKSPILEKTQAQAVALEERLKTKGNYKVFVSMRYWHPMSDIVAKNVQAYNPSKIILLPLYPQFSTTTTASSFSDWDASAKKAGLDVKTSGVCCYAGERGFIAAHAKTLRETYWKAAEHGKPRILFSAHGLPEKVIEGGDPYQWQVERTVAAIVQILSIDNIDHATCYQSRVGPMEWIGPSLDDEITRAGNDRVPVVIVPVSFVSEHSETLVELDIDYRRLANKKGVPAYHRVPALGTEPLFIESLVALCLSVSDDEGIESFTKTRYCPRNFEKCMCSL